jgi:hypothetical protein
MYVWEYDIENLNIEIALSANLQYKVVEIV